MSRRKVAMRLFDRAARIATSDRLNAKSGRPEDDLRRYVKKLRALSQNDPDKRFWTMLEKANLKLLKYMTRES